jgi:hypothetical protein
MQKMETRERPDGACAGASTVTDWWPWVRPDGACASTVTADCERREQSIRVVSRLGCDNGQWSKRLACGTDAPRRSRPSQATRRPKAERAFGRRRTARWPSEAKGGRGGQLMLTHRHVRPTLSYRLRSSHQQPSPPLICWRDGDHLPCFGRLPRSGLAARTERRSGRRHGPKVVACCRAQRANRAYRAMHRGGVGAWSVQPTSPR